MHDYFGMTIDFCEPSKVKFTMIDYIEKMLDEAPADMDGIAMMPTRTHFPEVNKMDPVMLDEDTTQVFATMWPIYCSFANVPNPIFKLLLLFSVNKFKHPMRMITKSLLG